MELQQEVADSESRTTAQEQRDSSLSNPNMPKELREIFERMAKDREDSAKKNAEQAALNEKIAEEKRKAWEADAPKREAEKVRLEIIEKERKTASLMRLAQFPLRYQGASLSDFLPINDGAAGALKACCNYVDAWELNRRNGVGLMLLGNVGTGKTLLACALGSEIIGRYLATVRYVKASDLLREVKSTYSKGASQTDDEVIRRFASYDLLIIDEAGVQFGTEAERMILFEIINLRYENVRPTLIISNLAIAALCEMAGDRVIDRMRENGGKVVRFEWQSYRGKQKSE